MISGFEYVLMAYGIWLCTFVTYIFVNKRKLKILKKTIATFEQETLISSKDTEEQRENESKK